MEDNRYHRLGEPGGPPDIVTSLQIEYTDSTGDKQKGFLWDAGKQSTELGLLRAIAHRFALSWGHDEFGWWAVIPATDDTNWEVWRQDDNGNKFRIHSSLTEALALASVAEFDASAHKQAYWASRPDE